jgi:hypothetical protein
MGQLETISEPMRDAGWALGPSHERPEDLKVPHGQYLVEVFLPLIVLLAMSVLVVTTIVTVVTTVAHAAMRF